MQFYIRSFSLFRDWVLKKNSPRLRRKRFLCCYHIKKILCALGAKASFVASIKNFFRAFGAKLTIGWGMLEVVIAKALFFDAFSEFRRK